jgi:hypothetical protein
MGGDDLESDDEYLVQTISDRKTDKLDEIQEKTKADDKVEKKRKREVTSDEDEVDEVPTKKSSAKILIETGRDLQNESPQVQAKFLWTALMHYTQLKGESIEGLTKLEAHNFTTSNEGTLQTRFKEIASIKKLKKWKPIGSPMVVVVCVSARRAVAVLKELSSLKVRAAKLFAKHMDVDEQRAMLDTQSFGIAVGTPNRLQALCTAQEGSRKASMYLGKTQLVLLDSHANPKGFTVCTLPDTAQDTMDFLREKVLPQLKARKDLKIAMI